MNRNSKVALIAIPAMLMFAGVVVAAHDGVLTAKDVSEVEASESGQELTIKGKVIQRDDAYCNQFHVQTGGNGTLHCFVLESTNEEGAKSYAFVSQVSEAPEVGENVVASGKLRFYYDVEAGQMSWDAFGTTGSMSEKQAGTFWNAEGNPFAAFAPAAIMWVDASDYHETWFF